MVQWFSDQWFWIQRYCAHHGLTVIVGFVLIYFVFHGLNGERGYFAKQDAQQALIERQEVLDALILKRELTDARVAALAPGRTQTDMVEQELYKLGYIKPGDVIIFKKDIEE